MNKKYILAATIFVFIVGGTILSYFLYKNKNTPIVTITPTPSISATVSTTPIPESTNIKYITFSSPKINFTFEYPVTWTYKEQNDNKNISWSFYPDSNNNNSDLAFAVVSPLTEAVDFCSGKITSPSAFVEINTYKTNDPNTYVTYEQCGDINAKIGSGYIYWQKGKRFSNADDIKDFYQINLIKFYFDPNFPERNNIARHIAQSIKIK